MKIDPWHVYILQCLDDTLYTGIAKDLAVRIEAHTSGKGAKYTKSRGVKKLLYSEICSCRVEAMKREREIKRWPRQRKLDLTVQG